MTPIPASFRQLVGEETYRIWLLYLAGSAVNFEDGYLDVHQILLARRDSGARPLTRDYMFQADSSAPIKGGIVVLGGIHMSPIPQMPYELLYGERVLRSVMNNTRADGRDFFEVAARIPIRPQVEVFPLEEANAALARLKHDAVRGAAVLRI